MADDTAPDTPDETSATASPPRVLDDVDATTTAEQIQAALANLSAKETAEQVAAFVTSHNPKSSGKITFKQFDDKDPKMPGHLWMWQTEGTIAQYGMTEAQALAQVRLALVGDPGRWFSCVLQDEDNKLTQLTKWADFKAAFKKRYMNTDNFTQQLKMFQTCVSR